jgi:hypothetical protein
MGSTRTSILEILRNANSSVSLAGGYATGEVDLKNGGHATA